MSHPSSWILVADRSRAHVYEPQKDGRLKRIHDMDEPAVRQRAVELLSDGPGRRADGPASAGARSAMDPKTTPQDAEVRRFVDSLSEWLHLAATRGGFDNLVIVAGPQMLGTLRDALSKPVSERVVGTLDRVMTKTPIKDLEDRLHEAFPAVVPERVHDIPAKARSGNAQPSG